jgi:hypothetical protein
MLLHFSANALNNYGGVTGLINFVYTATAPSAPHTCPSSGGSSVIGGVNGGWGSVPGVTHWFSTGSNPGMLCTVTFQAGEGLMLQASVGSWSVRSGDFLGLFDGPSIWGYPVLISNTSTPPSTTASSTFYSSGPSLTLVYSTGTAPLSGVTLSVTPRALADIYPSSAVCTRLISSFSVPLDSIGSTYNLLSNPGGVYGNNVGCGFTVTSPSGTIISLSFTAFVTELGLDVWSVFDGPSSAHPKLASYSGIYTSASLPAPINSTLSTLHITFTTSASGAYSGINAVVKAVNPFVTLCTLASASPFAFSAVSQGLYGKPSHLTSCAFRVTAPKGYAVIISFYAPLLNVGDTWSVYDGYNASTRLMSSVVYSGTLPSVLTSTGPQLFIALTAGTPTFKVSFVLSSHCTLLATAPSGSSFMGIANSPSGCGINEGRRMKEENYGAATHSDGAPCHVNTPRDECLLPTRHL